MSIHAEHSTRALETPARTLPADPANAVTDPAPAMIRAAGLSKRFKIYPRPWGRLTEWLTAGAAKRHDDFWALRDVSFEVARGESLGVIGVNGSGKSTLLKILSGAMYPTEGTFDVRGRVLSLLELGTGVNPQLTGRQNVVNSARLLAFPPDYVAGRMGDIEAFAELGEFFDRPVRLYSSGMLVRLVFSMFACMDPDVFVVDEALSVGDLHFQQKCAARIRALLDAGVTLLFVSHDLAAVEALCDRVMVLHGGRVRFVGDKRQAMSLYYSLVGAAPREPSGSAAGPVGAPKPEIPNPKSEPTLKSEISNSQSPLRDSRPPAALANPPLDVTDLAALAWQPPDVSERVGDGRIELTGVCYRRSDGLYTQCVERGDWLDLFVRYAARSEAGPVNCGVEVHDRFGQLLFAVNWLNAELEPLRVRAGDVFYSRFRLRADLEPGEYGLRLGASEARPDPASHTGWDQHLGGERYVSLPRAGKLAVLPRADRRRASFGPANLPYAVDRTDPTARVS
jgi:lipopolysaccharide transport system ATP-binding protein